MSVDSIGDLDKVCGHYLTSDTSFHMKDLFKDWSCDTVLCGDARVVVVSVVHGDDDVCCRSLISFAGDYCVA